MAAPNILSVKKVAESPNLTSIPSKYVYHNDPSATAAADVEEASIPIIDLSLLSSDNPDEKAKALYHLDHACQEWGFFIVILSTPSVSFEYIL